MIEPDEILFIGLHDTPVCWYRCALPAMNMGADWIGASGEPPNTRLLTGLVRNDTVEPSMEDYKVVVIQQPRGRNWLRMIRKLQERGIKVLYEVDDYLHGVGKVRHHDFAAGFSKKHLAEFELCMRVCDGLICSTEYLARRYRKFNAKTYVCPNGLDVARYALTRPERPTFNIGWAGGTGHVAPLLTWLNEAVLPLMGKHDDVCFVCIGQPGVVGSMQDMFGQQRVIGTPFAAIETYPAAMTMMDVALAPAGKGAWFQGKSDLRWLEAGALGIPIIADPIVYPGISHRLNGFHAASPAEAAEFTEELYYDRELGERVGAEAKRYVHTERNAALASLVWLEVCRAVAGDYDSVALVSSS